MKIMIGIIGCISCLISQPILPVVSGQLILEHKDEVAFGGYMYEYGTSVTSENEIIGFINIYDELSGEQINCLTFDDETENVVYLAQTSETTMLAVFENNTVNIGIDIQPGGRTIIIKYDLLGNQLARIELGNAFHEYHNHNNHLVLIDVENTVYIDEDLSITDKLDIPYEWTSYYCDQFRGTVSVNGEDQESLSIEVPGYHQIVIRDIDYEFAYEIVIHPEVRLDGVMSGNDYQGTVKVTSSYPFYLNETLYDSACDIEEPGIYMISVHGNGGYEYQKEFIVMPRIYFSDGVASSVFANGSIISGPVKIYLDGGTTYLDEEVYESGMIINPGNHQLEFYGEGDMRLAYHFQVTPSVTGIVDEGIYDVVSLTIFGQAFLNGQPVSGTLSLDSPGEYTLDLMMDQAIYESYTFSITGVVEEIETTSEQPWLLSIGFILLIGVGGYFILRKK